VPIRAQLRVGLQLAQWRGNGAGANVTFYSSCCQLPSAAQHITRQQTVLNMEFWPTVSKKAKGFH
jgi:hypothetical protein